VHSSRLSSLGCQPLDSHGPIRDQSIRRFIAGMRKNGGSASSDERVIKRRNRVHILPFARADKPAMSKNCTTCRCDELKPPDFFEEMTNAIALLIPPELQHAKDKNAIVRFLTTDFLTMHPEYTHILGADVPDAHRTGVLAAISYAICRR